MITFWIADTPSNAVFWTPVIYFLGKAYYPDQNLWLAEDWSPSGVTFAGTLDVRVIIYDKHQDIISKRDTTVRVKDGGYYTYFWNAGVWKEAIVPVPPPPPPPPVYECPYCGATFSTEAELEDHIAFYHPPVPPPPPPPPPPPVTIELLDSKTIRLVPLVVGIELLDSESVRLLPVEVGIELLDSKSVRILPIEVSVELLDSKIVELVPGEIPGPPGPPAPPEEAKFPWGVAAIAGGAVLLAAATTKPKKGAGK